MDREILFRTAYRKIGLVNLILSIIGFFVFYNDPIEDRIFMLVFINLSYHLLYGFMGFIPHFKFEILGHSKIALDFWHLISSWFVFMGAIFTLGVILNIIFGEEPRMFFMIITPFGFWMGAAFLNNYIMVERENLENK